MESDFQVFISYARPDREAAGELYDWLKQNGFESWVDFKKIKGGQNWDFEIKRALDRSSIIVILWSKNSRDRRGYIQRQLKLSLEKYQEKLIDDIFIIPVLIDDSPIPEQFKSIQALFTSQSDFREALSDAISHQIERLGGERERVQLDQKITWHSSLIKEEWEGTPGYAVELQILDFSSTIIPNVAQIGQHVRGALIENLFSYRRSKFEQRSETYNYAQDKWSRTSTFDAHCGDPIFCNKIVTLLYNMNWYGAGAAHPTHGHKTFAFLLEPLIRIESLESVFVTPDVAFSILQKEVRQRLVKYNPWGDEEPDPGTVIGLEEEWVNEGTEKWSDFRSFVFSENSLDIHFSSYQVAYYAAGTPHVSIPYPLVVKLMREEYIVALNIKRYTYDQQPVA
ncbi:TIR domain-containing protein [Mesorhizobium ciceri]|uniref:TIR domain-containing protein n=1 Tax=Mesorhizobium TaxID=68287 RepID=UPI00047B7FFB|nr:TIR domain-containing protein [Mesorhizobium ciceri]